MANVIQARRGILDLSPAPLLIAPDEHLARANGQALMLSMRELRLLTELARRADMIVSREELVRLVWDREMRLQDRSVDVYVRKLRVKLEAALPEWSFIHTHFGLGYRLAPQLRQAPGLPTREQGATRGAADSDRARTRRQGQ